MADLTPEQLERLAHLAAARDDIDKRMGELLVTVEEGTESDDEPFVMDGQLLRAVSLEFMAHATPLAEAAMKLDKIRTLLVERVMSFGLIAQIKEVLDG